MYSGEKTQLVWISKTACYESPYGVTGSIKLTGSKQEPKGICTDRIIGTRKGNEFPHWGIG